MPIPFIVAAVVAAGSAIAGTAATVGTTVAAAGLAAAGVAGTVTGTVIGATTVAGATIAGTAASIGAVAAGSTVGAAVIGAGTAVATSTVGSAVIGAATVAAPHVARVAGVGLVGKIVHDVGYLGGEEDGSKKTTVRVSKIYEEKLDAQEKLFEEQKAGLEKGILAYREIIEEYDLKVRECEDKIEALKNKLVDSDDSDVEYEIQKEKEFMNDLIDKRYAIHKMDI